LTSKTQKQYRIFVVDDEPVIASTLGLILSQQGFDATTFTNSLEALQAVQTTAPDLVIADVIMPGLSGIDLAIVIRETCPACTVLLFSGQTATNTMIEGAKARGHDFEVLPKPLHPLEILARVRSGLGFGSPAERSAASLQPFEGD
jgi:DNA-binding response OmpR family regulator